FGRTAQTKTPLAAKRGAISQTAQWFKRQRARLGQKFENVAVWAKDVIAQAIICLAAILSCGSYVPAWAKNYIHHKFF
ncbi:hypothetical protein ACE40V_24825, partial [Salmonella enterica]|uniref:hypothetical protein n=1 Tax=Salmonella enterica TaxID=28901 RepID=UPI003D2AC8FD